MHVQQVLEEIDMCIDVDEFFQEWLMCLKQAMEGSERHFNCVGALCRHPADQKWRVVAAAVYHHVHKIASSSARSEEEMFFLSIRGGSTRCIVMRRRRRANTNSSEARRKCSIALSLRGG